MTVMQDLRAAADDYRSAYLAKLTPEQVERYLDAEAAQTHVVLYGHEHIEWVDGLPRSDRALNLGTCR